MIKLVNMIIPVSERQISYSLLLSLLTLVSVATDSQEYVNDVEAPTYYKYDAKSGQFPWVVSFLTVEHCMGTLVEPSWVLTAAHCLELSSDPEYYTLRLGGADGQVETASSLHSYPSYHNSKTTRVQDHGNDIALVRVKNPFEPAATLQMRQTPYVSDTHRKHPCLVLGFVKEIGKPNEPSKVLQFARVYGYAFQDCYQKSRGQENVKLMMRHTLCTTGIEERADDACSGNPGGPLVCPVKEVKWENSTQAEVVGVSSWNEHGVYCGGMSRYTDVGYFRDWLKATINGNSFIIPRRFEIDVRQSDDLFVCSAPIFRPTTYLIFIYFVVLASFS